MGKHYFNEKVPESGQAKFCQPTPEIYSNLPESYPKTALNTIFRLSSKLFVDMEETWNRNTKTVCRLVSVKLTQKDTHAPHSS